jgi:hypothetical protein
MSAVAKIAKPVMRGLHVQQIKGNILKATVFATLAAVGFYFTVNKPRYDRKAGLGREAFAWLMRGGLHLGCFRIDAYKNFYANYDAEKDFQRMKVLYCIGNSAVPGYFATGVVSHVI